MLSHADAEDAFQATFVALLRASIRNTHAVGAWLHAVAVRISLKIRRGASRRRMRAKRIRLALRPEGSQNNDAHAAVIVTGVQGMRRG